MSINSVSIPSRMTIIESKRATVNVTTTIITTSRVANWALLGAKLAEQRLQRELDRNNQGWWWDNESHTETISHCVSCCSLYGDSSDDDTIVDSDSDTEGEKILTAARAAFCSVKETRL